MAQREVVVTGGVRTAIGAYGGSLKDIPPTKLGAIAIKEAVARAKIDPATVGHVVLGSVIHGEARDMYISRVAAIEGGLPVGTPCLTVNRLCGSGLQAIVSAAQHILLGDTDVALGAGAESMSRAAYFIPAARWGQRMGDAQLIDAMTGALHDPFGNGHMGVTAEKIAAQRQGAKLLASLVAYALAGVDPKLMGRGPIPAVRRVFEKAGLQPADMDVIESNEAFAVQAMAVTRDLGLDPAKVNPNGGAVALGHPIGATGCILTVKAIYELHRTSKRYALVTMCIGGGQGVAAVFARVGWS